MHLDKYAQFGVALYQIGKDGGSEDEVWRRVVREHIRLGIEPIPSVIDMVKRLVSGYDRRATTN